MSKRRFPDVYADSVTISNKLVVAGTDVTDAIAEAATLDGLSADVDELNKLASSTSTAAEIDSWAGAPLSATITVGAQVSTAINVTIQLEDADGNDLATRAAVYAYLSDDANGDSIAGTAPDGGVAIGADGVAMPLIADKAFMLVSEADGDIDIDVTESGTDTWYLILILPNGLLVASDPIALTSG